MGTAALFILKITRAPARRSPLFAEIAAFFASSLGNFEPVRVEIDQETQIATYLLANGPDLEITHCGNRVTLSQGKPARLKISSSLHTNQSSGEDEMPSGGSPDRTSAV